MGDGASLLCSIVRCRCRFNCRHQVKPLLHPVTVQSIEIVGGSYQQKFANAGIPMTQYALCVLQSHPADASKVHRAFHNRRLPQFLGGSIATSDGILNKLCEGRLSMMREPDLQPSVVMAEDHEPEMESLSLTVSSTEEANAQCSNEEAMSPGDALALVSSGPQAVLHRARTLSIVSNMDASDDEWDDDHFLTPRDQLYADCSAGEMLQLLLGAAAAGNGEHVRSLLAIPDRP
eukprot:SAG31_NODE_910_length_11078_cov_25.691062_10_plen_232_part_01